MAPPPMDLADQILMAMGAIGLTFTLFTLWVIRSMGRYNSYILLVINLTVAQMFYDLSVLLVQLPGNGVYYDMAMRTFSGVAASLWTNVISISVFYVVTMHKSLDIFKSYRYMLLVISCVAIIPAVGVPMTIYREEFALLTAFGLMYQCIRFASIVVNVLIYLYLQFILMRRSYRGSIAEGAASEDQDPIVILTNRLKYYPLIQIVTRVCVSYQELRYNYTYIYTAHDSTAYKATSVLYALSLPSAAIGYFLVFVLVTPGAVTHIKNGFRGLLGMERLEDDVSIRRSEMGRLPAAFDSPVPRKTIDNNAINPSIQGLEIPEVARQSSVSSHYVTDYHCYDEDELTEVITTMYNNDATRWSGSSARSTMTDDFVVNRIHSTNSTNSGGVSGVIFL